MWDSITQVMKANKKIGHYWFSNECMTSNQTILETEMIHGKYFISSDIISFSEDKTRKYTARIVDDRGAVRTVNGTRSLTLDKCLERLQEVDNVNCE